MDMSTESSFYKELSPAKVAVVILSLVIATGIGISIISESFAGMGSAGASHTETFTVTNPTIDQECTLENTPDVTTVTVSQFNGIAWDTVASTYVSVDGDVVTVDADGLIG